MIDSLEDDVREVGASENVTLIKADDSDRLFLSWISHNVGARDQRLWSKDRIPSANR